MFAVSSLRTIHRTLSGTTTPCQCGLGSDGNEWVLCIPQGSSIIRASPSDCLVSYPGHLFGGLTPLQKCNRRILHSQVSGLARMEYQINKAIRRTLIKIMLLFKSSFVMNNESFVNAKRKKNRRQPHRIPTDCLL